jgi:hypothetical protein
VTWIAGSSDPDCACAAAQARTAQLAESKAMFAKVRNRPAIIVVLIAPTLKSTRPGGHAPRAVMVVVRSAVMVNSN